MAEIYFTGGAADIYQEDTITVAGTWLEGETITLTINGNDLVITVGAVVTTTGVADVIKRSINASAYDDNLAGTESRNLGGQEIPEFTEIIATVSGSVVTIRGVTAGKPYTLASTTNSASGTVTDASVATATGSEHWDNVDNWSGGAVPVSTDDVIIDGRAAAAIKYGLNQSAVTLTSLTITSEFQAPKSIGLAEVNTDGGSSKAYSEYRDTYLKISATTVKIGQGDGIGSGRIKLNVGTAACTATVYNTGSPAERGVPSILFLGTNAANVLYLVDGSFGAAFFEGESATLATVETAGTLVCGDGVTLTNVDVNGGVCLLDSNSTTVDVHEGVVRIRSGTHTTVKVFPDGECQFLEGTLTTAQVSGRLDCSETPMTKTITNELELYKDSDIFDPHATLTLSNGFQTNHCRMDEVKLDFGMDRVYTVT